MTFRRRPSLGLDQALYEFHTHISSAFKLKQGILTPNPLYNLYFWREDENFHRFHQLHTGVTRGTMILGRV